MAIKKIKLPDNTTKDINDAREVAYIADDSIGLLDTDRGYTIGMIAALDGRTAALPGCEDGSEDYTLATTNNLNNYLPLSGGTMTGSPVLSNAVYLRANDTGGTDRGIMGINASDQLLIGYGTAGQGYETHLYGGSIDFHYGTGRAIGLTLNSDGQLVKANDTPYAAYDSGGTVRTLLSLSAANAVWIAYGTAGAGYYTHLCGNQIEFKYGTGRTTGMVLNNSGNVGIGTLTPAYKLDVEGAIHASSNVTTGGYISSASYVNSLGLKFPTNANRTAINATGWYRIWTGGARDTFPTSVLVNITKNYGGSASEGYLIEIGLAGNGQVTFNQISGTTQTTTRNITKIRYVYVYNTAAPSTYIDIYYSGTTENNVNISGLSGHGTFSAPTLVENTTGYTTVEFETQRFAFKTTRAIVAGGNITGASFIKTGGTSSQLLAADGSTRSITISSSEPASSDGSDGDIWIVI